MLGPRSLGVGVLAATWQMSWEIPKEWPRSPYGFQLRYLEREADVAISNTLEAGLGALWGEDPRYVRAPRGRVGSRVAHAVKTVVLAPRPDGQFKPAWGRFAGNVFNNVIENAWLPPSMTTPGRRLFAARTGCSGTPCGQSVGRVLARHQVAAAPPRPTLHRVESEYLTAEHAESAERSFSLRALRALRSNVPEMNRLLTADRGDAGRRLDLVVRRHLADVDEATRTRVQAWIESGLVTVNGAPVRRVAARAAFGDVVSVVLPEPTPRTTMGPENIGLDILYEDDHLLAINKPAGLVVHPTFKHATGTLMNALLAHAHDWRSPQRPSIVRPPRQAHVGARHRRQDGRGSREAAAGALVHGVGALREGIPGRRGTGHVKAKRGEIDLRLAPSRTDRRRIVASTTAGAASLTRFEARRARGGAAGRVVAGPLPPRHRAAASDPGPPCRARLADRRRRRVR